MLLQSRSPEIQNITHPFTLQQRGEQRTIDLATELSQPLSPLSQSRGGRLLIEATVARPQPAYLASILPTTRKANPLADSRALLSSNTQYVRDSGTARRRSSAAAAIRLSNDFNEVAFLCLTGLPGCANLLVYRYTFAYIAALDSPRFWLTSVYLSSSYFYILKKTFWYLLVYFEL